MEKTKDGKKAIEGAIRRINAQTNHRDNYVDHWDNYVDHWDNYDDYVDFPDAPLLRG